MRIASLWLLAGCASSVPLPPETPPHAVQQNVVAPSQVTTAPGPEKRQGTTIRGLRGTLNQDDIHQTMDARHGALSECIDASRRRMRYVDGDIQFAFKVDGEGKPFDVRPIGSDVGHQGLQDCFASVLAETAFPPPAGRTATRDFKWSMAVEPADRATDVLDPAMVKPLLKEQARDVYRECKLARRRNRFSVTLYVSPKGKVLTSGAVVKRGGKRAQEQLGCFLDQLATWRLPKVDRRSKITFTLQ